MSRIIQSVLVESYQVDSSPGAAAATMYVFSGEVADQEVTRGVAVCDGTDGTSGSDASDEDAQHNGGFRSSSRDIYEVTITSGGVLYVDLCAAVGGDQLATPVSALGVAATIGDGSLGRNGDELRCEGAGVINGRDDGAFLQYGGAVEDGRRSHNGSDNATLISSTSNSGDGHKVDGRLASCVFNRAPMVNARGTGSQAGGQMVIGKVSRTLFSEPNAKSSRETMSPLSRSGGSAGKNGSRFNWLKNENLEAIRVWSIGKELGFTFNGEEELVISKLKFLENRDSGKQKVVRRESNVSDDEDC